MHEGHDPDEGSEHEGFWPEKYKEVIRQQVGEKVAGDLVREQAFVQLYQDRYDQRFRSYEDFAKRITDMVTIGAENGADNAFDEANRAILNERTLPYPRRYAQYAWPEALNEEGKKEIRESIRREYGEDRLWQSVYREHHSARYPSYATMLEGVTDLVVLGATNGADDVLSNIYRTFIDASPLPPARRHAKRLRVW